MTLHALPCPQKTLLPLGAAALTALAGGLYKSELVLLLASGMLCACVVYSFCAVLILACVFAGAPVERALFSTPVVAADAGETTTLRRQSAGPLAAGRWRVFLPACVVRYRLMLSTAVPQPQARRAPHAPRAVRHEFPPAFFAGEECPLKAPPRGAYAGSADHLVIRDLFGLWEAALPVPQEEGVRLCVTPALPRESLRFRAGERGADESGAQTRRILGELADHRAYIPGDDPRRINWKIYGHLNDLFVRTETPEAPPAAQLAIVIDTGCDTALFTSSGAAESAVDALCSAVLGLCRAAREGGRSVRLLWPQGGAARTLPAERSLEEQLAYPVPCSLSAGAPPPFDTGADGLAGGGVLYAALPRLSQAAFTGQTLLDAALAARHKNAHIELFFIYPAAAGRRFAGAAYANALSYGKIQGVHAQSAAV